MDEALKFEIADSRIFRSAEPFEKDGQPWWLFNARAFKTGKYADKGIDATADWVKGVLANTAKSVPVGLEHKDTSFDGHGLARDFHFDEPTGSVFCYVELPGPLKEFVEYVGVGGLSVEIDGGITALDFTPRPRVGSALAFSEDGEADYARVIEFAAEHGELDSLVSAAQSKRDKENAKKQQEEVILMEVTDEQVEEQVPEETPEVEAAFEATPEPTPEEKPVEAQFDASALIAENVKLEAELTAIKAEKVEFEASKLVEDGKLPPALKPIAFALLSNDDEQVIKFDDGEQEKSVADLFRALIDGLKPTALFSADDVSGEQEDATPTEYRELAEAAKEGRRKLGVEE